MKPLSPTMRRFRERYEAWLAQRPAESILVPAVAAMLEAGILHPFDAEWVGRLRPDSQLAAAKKMVRPNFTMVAMRHERSTISHGHPGSRSAL